MPKSVVKKVDTKKIVKKTAVKSKKIDTKEDVNKNTFSRLKGMKDIRGQDFYNYQGMFEKAQEISEYYGFKPIEIPAMERLEVFQKGIGENTDIMEKEIYAFSIHIYV